MGKVRIIGTYQPKHSPLHGVDAKAKIVFMPLILIALIVAHSWVSFAAISALLAVALLLAQVRPVQLAPALRPLGFMALALIVLCALIPAPSFGGIWRGIVLSLRIALLVGFALAISATTTQTQLVDAFMQLLAPLGRLGLPTFKVSCALTSLMRLIPIAAEERARICAAQVARGVPRSIGRTASSAAQLFSALAVSSRMLAGAMERRGYDGSTVRASDHPMGAVGWLIIVLGIAAIVVAVIA